MHNELLYRLCPTSFMRCLGARPVQLKQEPLGGHMDTPRACHGYRLAAAISEFERSCRANDRRSDGRWSPTQDVLLPAVCVVSCLRHHAAIGRS